MWEYPSYPRSQVVTLMTFDLSTPIPEKAKLKESGEISLFADSSPCHGVVLWMEYSLTDDHVVSTGLVKVRRCPAPHTLEPVANCFLCSFTIGTKEPWRKAGLEPESQTSCLLPSSKVHDSKSCQTLLLCLFLNYSWRDGPSVHWCPLTNHIVVI